MDVDTVGGPGDGQTIADWRAAVGPAPERRRGGRPPTPMRSSSGWSSASAGWPRAWRTARPDAGRSGDGRGRSDVTRTCHTGGTMGPIGGPPCASCSPSTARSRVTAPPSSSPASRSRPARSCGSCPSSHRSPTSSTCRGHRPGRPTASTSRPSRAPTPGTATRRSHARRSTLDRADLRVETFLLRGRPGSAIVDEARSIERRPGRRRVARPWPDRDDGPRLDRVRGRGPCAMPGPRRAVRVTRVDRVRRRRVGECPCRRGADHDLADLRPPPCRRADRRRDQGPGRRRLRLRPPRPGRLKLRAIGRRGAPGGGRRVADDGAAAQRGGRGRRACCARGRARG